MEQCKHPLLLSYFLLPVSGRRQNGWGFANLNFDIKHQTVKIFMIMVQSSKCVLNDSEWLETHFKHVFEKCNEDRSAAQKTRNHRERESDCLLKTSGIGEKGKVVESKCIFLTPESVCFEYSKTFFFYLLGARIYREGTTRRVTKCAGVSVAVVTAGKYGLGLRQIRILMRENTACREAEKYALANTPNIFIMHDDHIFSSSGA